jgi:molybdopterin converting factor small subunit
MNKKIHLFSDLRNYTDNQNIIEVEGNTVGECIEDLSRQFPRIGKVLFETEGKIAPRIFVAINKKSIHREERDKPVNRGDDIYLGLLIDGG